MMSFLIVESVSDPPKIAPFEFPVHSNAGDKISASCLVSGSSPVKINWLKDDIPLSPSTAKVITEDDISTIVFKSVGAAQTGNYTCVAENSFGSDRFSARLSVKCESESESIHKSSNTHNRHTAPPSWRLRPSDVRIEDGGDAVAKCEADGDPDPVVVWKRRTGMTTCLSCCLTTDSRSDRKARRGRRSRHRRRKCST